jgi:tRNA(Ile2)-agmatinylcytidine synthase
VIALKLHIGIDDTDSPARGCTTYVATQLVWKLLGMGARFVDYPTLLRLNPNTPWKTRGNASVCLRFEIDGQYYISIKESVKDLIEEYGEFSCDNTNPGAVFLKGNVPRDIKMYSNLVVKSLVTKYSALELIKTYNMDYIEYKNGRGLIGALAAIGGVLESDHTYELLTYRIPEKWGTKRRVNHASINRADAEIPELFSNFDEKGNILITPRGPDPVLYGVRGESAESVFRAFQIIKSDEPLERWIIYRTNQGTDAHFSEPVKIDQLEPYNPATVKGIVTKYPETLTGGHVILKIMDETGEVDCAAFEPTGNFRKKVQMLIPSDHVTVFSGVSIHKCSLTMNIEKLIIDKLAEQFVLINPKCPECGGSTESMGKDQGLRCKKCGYKNPSLVKIKKNVQRKIQTGLFLPDRGANRHLTKPFKRYGKEKTGNKNIMLNTWVG